MKYKSVCVLNPLIRIQIEDAVYEYARAWNEYWAEHKDAFADHIEITYFSERLMDDERSRVVSEDIPVFVGALLLMTIYLIFTLGKISCIGARPWLALSAVIILIGAIIVGFSISLCTGFAFNLVVMMVPFILLGVGVDDMS